MGRWLKSLAQPIGLMACNDICGRRILNLCRVHGLRVPEHMAVIGVDNDEVLCDLAEPPMSSIMLPTERIGYQAAELLSGMMDGTKPLRHEILIPPSDVMRRRSTDVAAVEDPYVAAAAGFHPGKSRYRHQRSGYSGSPGQHSLAGIAQHPGSPLPGNVAFLTQGSNSQYPVGTRATTAGRYHRFCRANRPAGGTGGRAVGGIVQTSYRPNTGRISREAARCVNDQGLVNDWKQLFLVD